jgi:hypothetical protein
LEEPKIMRVLALFLIGGLLAIVPRSAIAWDHDDHERKHWKHSNDWDRDHHRRYGEACFRDDHLRMIHDYYHPRDLPPGLQKKLYRTGQLPSGWERRIRPFPYEIERRLPPLCFGCARGYMDGYAIIYQPRTRVIVDFHAVLAP